MIQKTAPAANETKSGKRSILGLLFNPRLGTAISPMRDSTKMFVHLLASVFAIYGLFPKDHPALKDQDAPLSLFQVLNVAWQRVEFSREGLPRAIMFFTVVGMMAVSLIALILFLLSMFVGHAHAQGIAIGSTFSPESKDIAQSWLDYLFNNPSGSTQFPTFSDTYGDATAQMQDPFAGSVSLQKSLMAALAFYSGAILIIAALLLFYHLAAMVVETAHHGVPMGKRASQIWAPIRLVFAIGLLVPVNGGLNCGQFIVIKIAELGSGMASQAWDLFLKDLEAYNSKSIAPTGPMVNQVALDIIRMEACRASWNYHIQEQTNSGLNMASVTMNEPTGTPYMMGNVSGTKYSYSSNAVGDVEICGWYFIPNGTVGATAPGGQAAALAQQAAQAQANAIKSSMTAFTTAAQKILSVIPPTGQAGATPTPTPPSISFDPVVIDAVAQYQQNLNNAISALSDSQAGQISTAISTIQQYGWAMAGTFLNTIDRLQANLASAASSSIPVTSPPKLNADIAAEQNDARSKQSWWSWGGGIGEGWNIRKMVANDMAAFDYYQSRALAVPSTTPNNIDAQCAAMVGLDQARSEGGGLLTDAFAYIERQATWYGVWAPAVGTTCGNNTGAQTFSLGVQINGGDPIAQIAHLGHANLDAAGWLLYWGMGSSAAGGIVSSASSAFGGKIGGFFGNLVGGGISAYGSIMNFVALIFFACGFTLAYLLPMMPFMRFFFAVLSWVAGIIEAVIAIPLVALAHLNPEGEGLPGQSAKGAYFFLFNLFLRPILCVFGLICGLIMFMIAISFLNYCFAIAFSGAGGTSYHATMSKVIGTILYVIILYICANHSFQLIDHLPEQALRWMGASGQSMPKMGDVGSFEQKAGVAASFAGQQLVSNASNSLQHLSSGAGKSMEHGQKYLESRGDLKQVENTGLSRGQIKGVVKTAESNNMSHKDVLTNPNIMEGLGQRVPLTTAQVDAAERYAAGLKASGKV